MADASIDVKEGQNDENEMIFTITALIQLNYVFAIPKRVRDALGVSHGDLVEAEVKQSSNAKEHFTITQMIQSRGVISIPKRICDRLSVGIGDLIVVQVKAT